MLYLKVEGVRFLSWPTRAGPTL